MIRKTFTEAFKTEARTLCPDIVGTNDSGWLVKAKVHEDYFEWVNYFEAFHEEYGIVYGDFEDEVYASNEEAFEHFTRHHEVCIWDYWDIQVSSSYKVFIRQPMYTKGFQNRLVVKYGVMTYSRALDE